MRTLPSPKGFLSTPSEWPCEFHWTAVEDDSQFHCDKSGPEDVTFETTENDSCHYLQRKYMLFASISPMLKEFHLPIELVTIKTLVDAHSVETVLLLSASLESFDPSIP